MSTEDRKRSRGIREGEDTGDWKFREDNLEVRGNEEASQIRARTIPVDSEWKPAVLKHPRYWCSNHITGVYPGAIAFASSIYGARIRVKKEGTTNCGAWMRIHPEDIKKVWGGSRFEYNAPYIAECSVSLD